MKTRTEIEKQKIVDRFGDPHLFEGVLCDSDIEELTLYYDSQAKIHKNTGPVTVNIDFAFIQNSPLRKVWDAVENKYPSITFMSGFFFYVEKPHIIHNDDSFELPDTYKGITVPLKITRTAESREFPKLCFFKQYYLDGPAKFMHGSKDVPVFYNKIVYDYEAVVGKTNEPFPDDIRERFMPHIRPANFNGLSFDTAYDSVPGNALVFDAVKLHAASDFRAHGITSKLGISIFTTKGQV